MDEEYIGTIKLFAGDFAPKGYMYCAGQLLPISGNEALFSIIGANYGGDGRVNFALPDLRGRIPVGQGQISGTHIFRLGTRAGTEETTLTISNLPPHNHITQLSVSSENATDSIPVAGASIAVPGTSQGRDFTPTLGFNTVAPNVNLNDNSVITGLAGAGMPINNMQPYLTLNYIICVYGIYPTRND